MDLLFPKFLRDRVQNICQEFTFPAGGNSMLAKNSIKAARGLAFISVHTLIFNVRDNDWFAGFADWMAGDFLS